MTVSVALPFKPILDPGRFNSVFNAKMYVGTPDTDPTIVLNQVEVFFIQEDGTRVTIPQPIRTNSGGYPVHNGVVIQPMTANNYSLTIQNRNDVTLFNVPNADIAGPLGQSSHGQFDGYTANNVADLITGTVVGGSVVPHVEGQVWRWSGYYEAGDGGGNTGIVKTGAHTADGGAIFSINSNTYIEAEVGRVAFVRRWGARLIGGTFNDQPFIQAATNYISTNGGGDVFIDGDANLIGVDSPDAHDNGILVPFSNFQQVNAVRFIGGILGGRLRAGSNNMILIRASNVGTVAQNLKFEGAGFSDVWAMGAIPEDRQQTITQVSQSYCKMLFCQVDNCSKGFVGEPGPTVGGRDSGCFYLKVQNVDFNLTTTQVWFKGSQHEPTNRVTRSVIENCTMLRGNVGINAEYCTECTFANNYFEFFNLGTFPRPIPSAIYLGPNTENCNIISGSEEACDLGIDNSAISFNNRVNGFPLSGINNNVGFMPQTLVNRIQVTNDIEGVQRSVDITFKQDGFVKLEADSTGTGVSDCVLSTGGADRMRWFNGETRHIGSAGNINFSPAGDAISFTGGGASLVSAGFIRYTSAAGGHFFRVGSSDALVIETDLVRPNNDNITALGASNRRWSEVFAGNGTINTSDARTKTEVRPFTVNELNAAKALSNEIGFFQFLNAVEIKGDSAREHVGMTVQRAIEVMEEHDLDPFNYGFICFDEWEAIPAKPAVYMKKGDVIQEEKIIPEKSNDKGQTVPEYRRPAILADGTELLSEAVEGVEAGSMFSFRPDQLNRFIMKGFEQRLKDAGI